MSEFEFNSMSSDSSVDDEVVRVPTKNNKPNNHIMKISKELHLHYSNLFIDSFCLIDMFVKSQILTYESFLGFFDSTNFHQIYAKPNRDIKQLSVSPHHYITITQDIFAVSTKFLRSQSREARIGAVYLLYTLYKTQPLKSYLINIKMEPIDYNNTKKLVEECFNEGLLHPAYCFYDLDIKKRITITATAVNPCLEANYPRFHVRKHMGRVADNYFKIEYEKRSNIEPINKLQLMEQQMRTELSYINKLSNLTLGRDIAPECKVELSKALIEISAVKQLDTINLPKDDISKKRYKNKKVVVFPGKNDNMLEDMVTTAKSSDELYPSNSHSRKKKKRRLVSNKIKMSEISTMKQEPCTSSSMPKLSVVIDSDSSQESIENDDLDNSEDMYGEMIWRMIEGDDNNEFFDGLPDTKDTSNNVKIE